MKRDTKEIFSENLRDAMYIKGYSQRQLANKIGCSEISVWGWCNGEYIPRSNFMDKLCRVLNTTEASMLTDKNHTIEQPEEKLIAQAILSRSELLTLFKLASVSSAEDVEACIELLTGAKK